MTSTYVDADILRILKWYDTQRSNRWFKSWIFLKICFQTTILSRFFARNDNNSTFKKEFYYFLLVFAKKFRFFFVKFTVFKLEQSFKYIFGVTENFGSALFYRRTSKRKTFLTETSNSGHKPTINPPKIQIDPPVYFC